MELVFTRFHAAPGCVIALEDGQIVTLPVGVQVAHKYKRDATVFENKAGRKQRNTRGFRLTAVLRWKFMPDALVGLPGASRTVPGLDAIMTLTDQDRVHYALHPKKSRIPMIPTSTLEWKDDQTGKPLGAGLTLESEALFSSQREVEELW